MLLSPPLSRHEFATPSSSPPLPSSAAPPRSNLNLSTSPSYASFSDLYAEHSPTQDSSTDLAPAASSPKTANVFASSLSVATPPGSKTNAFFSSSFSPLPTPPISSRLPHGENPKPPRSRTDDFFSSRSVSSPSPLPSPPRILEPSDALQSNSFTPSSVRTRTVDFFSTSRSEGPSPPPSLRSASSVSSFTHSTTSHTSPASLTTSLDNDPETTPSLPPLARFFPSRYASMKDDDDIAASSLSHSPKRRGFVDIDEGSISAQSHSAPASPARGSALDPAFEPTATESATRRKSPLPPLSRLYPSRYASIADRDLSDSPPSSSSPSRRDFVDIEDPASFVASPIDGRSEFHSAQPSEGHSVESPARPTSRLPPLSRLFPSRYSSIASRDEDSFVGHSSSQATNVPRENHVSSPPESYRSGSILGGDESGAGYQLLQAVGEGAFSSVWKGRRVSGGEGNENGELVAVKMIAKQANNMSADRTRASFVREADILQRLAHVPHPSLPVLHAAFSLNTHHVIVLEYMAGGELFDVVNSDEQHSRLTGGILQRIWTELVSAVAWMHSHSVVHRDIKLENILFTANPLLEDMPSSPIPGPLIKLTDFGLARVIDPADPWLTTRCGSESYAAPELLTAGSRGSALKLEDEEPVPFGFNPTEEGSVKPSTPTIDANAIEPITPRKAGTYDGRETDAWALGVVLFAVVTRKLPFDPDSVEAAVASRGGTKGSLRRKEARNAWMMRIVRGEYEWPDDSELVGTSASSTKGVEDDDEGDGEPKGTELAMLEGVRDVVRRLLVSDPTKRARMTELADEEVSWGGAVGS